MCVERDGGKWGTLFLIRSPRFSGSHTIVKHRLSFRLAVVMRTIFGVLISLSLSLIVAILRTRERQKDERNIKPLMAVDPSFICPSVVIHESCIECNTNSTAVLKFTSLTFRLVFVIAPVGNQIYSICTFLLGDGLWTLRAGNSRMITSKTYASPPLFFIEIHLFYRNSQRPVYNLTFILISWNFLSDCPISAFRCGIVFCVCISQCGTLVSVWNISNALKASESQEDYGKRASEGKLIKFEFRWRSANSSESVLFLNSR